MACRTTGADSPPLVGFTRVTQPRNHRRQRQSLASVILGILAFRHFGQGYAVLLLAIWIGIGFIFRGVAAVASAISDPLFPGRGWAIFFGVISIIAGVVVLAYPFDSIVTLALVVGIWLVIVGVMEVISGFGMRSDVKKVENVTGTAGRQAVAG